MPSGSAATRSACLRAPQQLASELLGFRTIVVIVIIVIVIVVVVVVIIIVIVTIVIIVTIRTLIIVIIVALFNCVFDIPFELFRVCLCLPSTQGPHTLMPLGTLTTLGRWQVYCKEDQQSLARQRHAHFHSFDTVLHV